MARILLGWELGAGSGHSTRLIELGAILSARGHTPVFAPQQIGPFAGHGPTWQAPVWPRLLEPLFRHFDRPPSTMGDILAYLGLDDGEAMAAMIMAWDRLIAATRPDAVIAEYAPALQLAANGRVPLLAFGTGFTLPPADMAHFPSFSGAPAVLDEAALLATLNGALGQAGRAPLKALPEIFAADRSLVATFAELDPYRRWRSGAVAVPAVCGPVPFAGDDGKGGDELFVYFNATEGRTNAFWQGIVDSKLPVRVHDARLTAADVATLEGAGVKVERAPVPFSQIVARSRLVLSHGGLGFASSALLAGLPQIIMPFDAEKRLTGEGLAELGVCRRAAFDGLEPDSFAAFLRDAWADADLRGRARAAAPEFRARMTRTVEVEAADLVETLV